MIILMTKKRRGRGEEVEFVYKVAKNLAASLPSRFITEGYVRKNSTPKPMA